MLLQQGSIGSNSSAEVQEYLLNPQIGHVYHCFDYLRQSLMCAGDMTIEWPREEEDGSRFAFDGWGVEHQCKDWVGQNSYTSDSTTADLFAERNLKLHEGTQSQKRIQSLMISLYIKGILSDYLRSRHMS